MGEQLINAVANGDLSHIREILFENLSDVNYQDEVSVAAVDINPRICAHSRCVDARMM